MKDVLGYQLDKDMFSANYEYFFAFLGDRFEHAVELWIKELKKRFNKTFKPIWILPAKQNEYFKKDNYIIINRKLKEIKTKLNKEEIVYLQDAEDLNKEFSESGFVKELIDKLAEKQGRVFILGFTSSCLDVKNPKAVVLGPNPKIATQFDNKIEHIKLFEKLNVSRNKVRIHNSINEVKEKENYPFYISAAYTSGGHESKSIYTEQDLDIFYSELRNINKKNQFLVANLITDAVLSPNVNAIIDKDTQIICITDQILRGNAYLGNIYPSKANDKIKNEIIAATKIIGNYLANLGFKGLFGLDFIVDSKGKLYTVDLNPRRQGGYLCNILMSKKINIIELELALALGEQIPQLNFKDFQVDYAWAHSKIKPYNKNTRVVNCFKEGTSAEPFLTKGSKFSTVFYPNNHIFTDGCAGYFIVSGDSHEEVKKSVIKETEVSISTNFELYEAI